MKVKYYLKRAKAKRETSIYARYSYDGGKDKVYIGEHIDPNHWSTQTGRVKRSSSIIGYSEFNNRLDHIEQTIKNVYRTLLNDAGGNPVDKRKLKDAIYAALRPEVNANKTTLLEFMQCMIDESKSGLRINNQTGKRIANNTIKTYTTTLNHLMDFNNKIRKIDFANVDLSFYSDFKKYLIEDCSQKNNSVGKSIKILKLVLREAAERGLKPHDAYKSKKFAVVREESFAIYLNVRELNALAQLDLSGNPTLEAVRDQFLISCNTGLRFSDVTELRSSDIKEDGFIHIRQLKTNEDVAIPVDPIVETLLKKYEGRLPTISNQKTNEYLKKIGSMVDCLKETVILSYEKGGERVQESVKKHDLISTHTGRRSFATNQFIAGRPVHLIMAVTGHKTEKAFLLYIKLSQTEKAKMLKQLWQQTPALRVA